MKIQNRFLETINKCLNVVQVFSNYINTQLGTVMGLHMYVCMAVDILKNRWQKLMYDKLHLNVNTLKPKQQQHHSLVQSQFLGL